MVLATVLIPTHDHADSLLRAVASVQAQTLGDFELFIVGDGAPERTRATVADLGRADSRIRFFDHPKGPRHGEIYRHAALQEAQGSIICYLSDDDLWLPHHLQTMADLLETADFAHTVHVEVRPGDTLHVYTDDLADPAIRRRMLDETFNFFGLSFGGHTRDAYRRLPHGWRTTPPGIWTDLSMWRQFLAEPWCRARTAWRPSALHFASPDRSDWSLDQRLVELDRWAARVAEPGFTVWLNAEVMGCLRAEVARRDRMLAEREHGIGSLQGEVARRDQMLAERDRSIAWLQGEVARRDVSLTSVQERLEDLDRQIALLEAQVAREVDEAGRLRQEAAALDATLDTIYRSRLWRAADVFWRARRRIWRLRDRVRSWLVGLTAGARRLTRRGGGGAR